MTLRVLSSIAASVLLSTASLAQLQVTTTQPALNARNVAAGSALSVTFDRAVNAATFTPQNFWAFARWSGPVAGAVTFSNSDRTATLTPNGPFFAGEVVTLIMSHNLRAADGTFMRPAGYTLMFTVGVAPSTGEFRHLTTLSDRDASNAQTRIYGGLACDLNRDGWCDMTMVNEVSADLRVFLNRHDGSGLFQPMLSPYTPIPFESSPNRPADFDRDGFFDIVTTSDGDNKITIAYGNGNGTFRANPTQITAGGNPRGIGILDFDGDGDLDIAVANVNGNTIMLLANDGAGHFPASPPTIPAPGGPYGMVAADMNNDGILDLVAGNNSDNSIVVFLGNGSGGFTRQTPRACGGPNWVLQTGDLNGDGKLDVVSANSFAANGSVLLGNGLGGLGAATIYSAAGHCPSTDLADIDGDGDLDWVLSSFIGGRWYLYRNNGAGVMTLDTVFIAPSNPACTLFADFNNDGAVDLMLLDEIADVIVVMQNIRCGADFNNDGDVGTDADIEAFFECLAGSCCAACQGADFNGDGDTGTDGDIESFFRVLGGGAC